MLIYLYRTKWFHFNVHFKNLFDSLVCVQSFVMIAEKLRPIGIATNGYTDRGSATPPFTLIQNIYTL